MRGEQFQLRRALNQLTNADDLQKAAERLSASIALREQRRQHLPQPSYDNALPVVLEREAVSYTHLTLPTIYSV